MWSQVVPSSSSRWGQQPKPARLRRVAGLLAALTPAGTRRRRHGCTHLRHCCRLHGLCQTQHGPGLGAWHCSRWRRRGGDCRCDCPPGPATPRPGSDAWHWQRCPGQQRRGVPSASQQKCLPNTGATRIHASGHLRCVEWAGFKLLLNCSGSDCSRIVTSIVGTSPT